MAHLPGSPTDFRYLVQTFGCQMNVHDSDRMDAVLRAAGGKPVDAPEDADLVVVNTCSVREKGEQKLRSEVGKLALVKRSRPDLVIAVAGCVAQQEGEKLLARIRHVDLVVGPDNLAELPALLVEQMAGAPPTARAVFDVGAPRFLPWSAPVVDDGGASVDPGRRRCPVVGLVTTMKGCDERCSFCIVPYTRGPERCRPAREVVDEVRAFVDAGAREVLLLGQTVNSFRDPALPSSGGDDPDETQFPELLRLIAESVPLYRHGDAARDADAGRRSVAPPGLARLRYTSPHPRHATASLARAHAEIDVLARHVHLPVQSGSDRVLRRMIRRYTRAEYVARAERLKAARPGLTLSTDVIVGFPGETEDDFAETLSIVREVGFVSLYAFKYSPRPYTPALRLPDDVSEETKSDRLTRLFALAAELGAAHLESLVGTRQEVLVEGPSKSEKGDLSRDRVQGRTARSEIVHIDAPGAGALVGSVVEVAITRANKHSLAGASVLPIPLPFPVAAPPSLPSPDGSRSTSRPARSLPLV